VGLALSPPRPDQLELTLMGPGFGESIVIHVGNGKWVLVDSCVDNTSNPPMPAALRYLASLGITPADAVSLIIATHWHDDHIRGMSTLLSACPQAKFCLSSALSAEEFFAMVTKYDIERFSKSTTGVREIHEVFNALTAASRKPIRAVSNKPIFKLEGSESGHGYDCIVTALTPSDAQLEKFYFEITALMPAINTTMQRCTPQGENDMAVVTWVSIGPVAILMGSDLQETKNPDTGWSVIVDSALRPAGQATIFKIPHHGAANSHSESVWDKMLVPAPFALLTPFNRGSKHPTVDEIKAISGRTSKAYSTSNLKLKKATTASRTADKTLREAAITITESEPPTGLIRLRNGGLAAFNDWTLELGPNACQIGDVHT
jgi:beta-lactamase superfamily II metal-dependent hydrolase